MESISINEQVYIINEEDNIYNEDDFVYNMEKYENNPAILQYMNLPHKMTCKG